MNRLTLLSLTSLCLLHYTSLASFGLPNNFFYGFMDCTSMLWIHDNLLYYGCGFLMRTFQYCDIVLVTCSSNFFICCIIWWNK